jgi:tetratricopeptide (TPR) repeat protein
LTDRALELDPKSISAHVARAQALLAKGDMRQSEAMVLDVLNREPASIPALTLLTSIRVRQGKSKEILKRIAPLVDQQPENAGLRYLLAVAYYLSGDAQRAESEAKQVLKLDAKTPRAHVLLAAIYFTTGKPEDAKQQLRAAIDVDPRNLNHYLLLASQYEKEQRWDEAVKLYEKARQIDVDSPVLANQLAYLYLEHGGDLNLALDLAQEAKRKLPNSPQVSDTLGWAYYKRGLADQAIAHIRRCVEAIPSNAECQYHLGMAYIAAGNPRAAEKHLRLALKDPGVAWSARAQEALSSIPQGAR